MVEIEDDLLATQEASSHLLHFPCLCQPTDQAIDSGLTCWVARCKAVLHEFEREADRFRHVHPVGNAVFEDLEVVRLCTHLLTVEGSERKDTLRKQRWLLDSTCVVNGCLEDQVARSFPRECHVRVLKFELDVIA